MSNSRWRAIADQYRADIESGKLGPGDRLPSDAALSELCGVSRVTAHRALAELHRLGLVTREGRKGTIVAEREDKTTGRIALVLDQVVLKRDFPRADLLGGIHEGLGRDYGLLWCDSMLSVDREIEFLRRMPNESDGLLCWPTGHPKTKMVLKELANRKVPLVCLDRVPDDINLNAVISDSVEATERALNFLIERGHKRIALFTFDKPHVSTVVERTATYDRVMAEHGIPTQGLVRRFPAVLEFDESQWFHQAIQDALFAMVKGNSPITAVLCVQDMFCAAVLDSVDQMGLSLPDDLEVATFNDWPSLMLRHPWLAHRIKTRAADIGKAAAQRLRAQIDGSAGEPVIQRIPAEFVIADAGIQPASTGYTY